MSELKIYFNGEEWVIARSPQHAIEEWNEMMGDDYIENEYGDLDSWSVWDREKFSFLVWESDLDRSEWDDRFKVLPHRADQGLWKILGDVSSWIDKEGVGYLAGPDY